MCRNVAVFLFITIKDKDLLTGNEYGMVVTIIRKRVESCTGWWSNGRCIYCAKRTTEVIFKAEYIALFSGIVSRRNCSKITLDKKGNEW